MLFGEVLADIFPDRSVLGGAPFNVAHHLKALGRNPVLLSRVGDDRFGGEILGFMKRNGMTTAGVQMDKTHPTGQVKVHLEKGNHRFEILPMQAYDFIHPAVARMVRLPLNPALVYFGTLAQRHEVSRRALSTLLRSTNATKFLDINLRSPWYEEHVLRQSLMFADIVKLNVEELLVLAEMLKLNGNDPHEQASQLAGQFRLESVIVTCGADGAWRIDRDDKFIKMAGRGQSDAIADTVGAGDGFAAVYILGTLRNWAPADILERANDFAAAICGIRGAIPDSSDFYTPFIKEWEL